MESDRFDELSKALARATSRRETLRYLGGVAAGAVLASLPGWQVFARGLGGGNSACAHFCAAVFGEGTPAAGQCTSDAAHRRHGNLCQAAGANPTNVCCAQNASGYCASFGGAVACPSGQVCQDGACVVPCTANGGSCALGTDCCSGICDTTASQCVTCIPESDSGCASNSDCCNGLDCSPYGLCEVPCFIAGTLIAMADGTSRPIELIQDGELVLGDDGHVNQVTGIKLPLLGANPIYGLNGGSPFVTGGHPFKTQAGWKAIDPAAAAIENPRVPVSRLTIGDHLMALVAVALPVGARAHSGEVVDVRIEPVALCEVQGQPADPATQLYNLELDGNHTYFANDLLVHNY